MSESKFEILTSTESVIGKLKDYLKLENIEKIEVYCSDFENYKKNNTSPAFQIYTSLLSKADSKKENFIQIYNYISFSHQSLIDSLNKKETKKETKKELDKKDDFYFFEGTIKNFRETQDMVASYLEPIAQEAKKRYSIGKRTRSCSVSSSVGNIEKESFENLSEIFDDFLSNSDDLQKDLEFISSSLKNLGKNLIEKFDEVWKNENIVDGDIGKIVSNSIDVAFKTLIKELSDIKKDNNALAIKATIKFSIQVIPAIIDVFSKGGVSLSWFDLIQTSIDYINDLSDFNNSKYLYSIMLPLYQLFTQKIAPIFTLVSRVSIKNAIYIYTKEKIYFIDYSGCNIYTKDYSIFTQFNCAISGEYSHNTETSHKASSFLIKCSQENEIEKNIKNFFSTLNPRINFLCSPYFTSYKLTHWLQESTTRVLDSNNNKIGANYFILTQCPIKLKAGIGEEIIKRMGYEIKDSINRTSQSPKLTQGPKKYNPVVDYSKYEIQINANDNQPFVLSLSPFGFVPQSKYEEMKKMEEELNNLNWGGISGEIDTNQLYENQKKEREYTPFVVLLNYIRNFFQSDSKIDEYFKKDKDLFMSQIELYKNFFVLLGGGEDLGNAGRIAIYYPHHIILMSLMFQTLKENYKKKISYNTQENKTNTRECILIESSEIEVTSFHSVLYTDSNQQNNSFGNQTYLCYSKEKRKDIPPNEKVFCIQEFAEKIFEGTSPSLDHFYALHFNGKPPSTPQEKEREKELILCYLLAIKSIISIFPFASFLPPCKNLNEKILKAMLNYPILFETFYNQVVRNFSLHTLQNKVAKEIQTLTEKEKVYFDWHKFASDEIRNFIISDIQSFGDLLLDKEELQELIKKYLESGKDIREMLFSSLGSYTFSHIKSLALDLLVGGSDRKWITKYEEQKKAFETILYTKFTDKDNAPLALERDEGVYYPIGINQTFLSFSFQNLVLGGEFCTGGLGYLKSNFYLLQETTSGQSKDKNTQESPSIVRNYQLNILFSLLCLDELRGETIGEKVEDQDFFNQNYSKKEFINYILNIENKTHKAICKSYDAGSGEDDGSNQAGGIDSYQVIMQYFSDIQIGILDTTTKDNDPNPKKHREAIRALDNIGKNNIRGLYVGISENSRKEVRPKLIGRLATTIIMKDGLWIG